MRPLLLGLFVFSVGCAREREPAPTELKELSYYLFERWEEAELLPEAVDNMGDRISEIADTDEGEDGLALGTIPDRVADSVPHPDIDNHTIGVIGAEVSRFPIDRHAGHIPLRDQVFSNPNTYDQYDREITEGSTSEFEGGSGLLRTRNEVITATFGVTIPYVLFKDYRWVEGERYDAIVARSWIKDASCGDGGSNCVEHTYSVDLWFQDGGGTANRATASWSQLVTSIEFGEDLQVATLSTGIQNVFEYTDRFLEEGG